MQTNSLYAQSDSDIWMADWSMSMNTPSNQMFGDYDGSAPEFGSPAHYAAGNAGDELYEVWTTAQADEPELPQPSSFSYSAAFNEEFVDADGNSPDFDIVASDGVHFSVTTPKLRSSSNNDFGGLLALKAPTASVSLSAFVLNLVLHAVYGLPPTRFAPSVDDIDQAVDTLELFGLSKQALVARDTPLFQVILMRAPSEPLACYRLAAHAGLEDLAVLVSSYTLGLNLADLTNDDAERIGPHYLKRLFFLHLGRVDALKRILFPPPSLHPSTDDCKAEDQRPVGRAWTVAVAEMSWQLNPNISVSSLEDVLSQTGQDFTCTECLGCIKHRIKQLQVDWSLIKSTI